MIPMSHGGDGLGPVYNETSCVACHGQGAPGGAGPENKNVVLVTASLTGPDKAKDLDQIHPGFRNGRSTVLHRYGTDPRYGVMAETVLRLQPRRLAKALARIRSTSRIRGAQQQTTPDQRLHDRSISLQPADGVNLIVSQRNTPALFGAGRIDAIPSDVLVAVAAHQPAEIRGQVSRTPDGRVGRFGWKAQIASLREFVRAACANELGLEVPGHSQAASPLAPSQKAKGLDMTEAECDDLVAYVRALPAPVAIDPSGPQGTQGMREGRRLFADVGCADCHAPTLGDVRGIYSDLLLHDMGPSLSDSGSYYGIEGPNSPGGADCPGVAHPAAVGLPRFRALPPRRPGREPGGGGRAARRTGPRVDATVLRPLRGGSVPGRGVPEIAGRALGDAAPGVVLAAELESRIRAGGGAHSREPRPAAMGRGRGPRPDATT